MNQSSRQALIELLFLSLYLDNHLSLAEDDVLNDALDSLGWESEKPREKFIFSAFALARGVSTDPLQADDFLAGRAHIIRDAGDEGLALTWLSRVLGSDGISPTEKRFLEVLESRMFG